MTPPPAETIDRINVYNEKHLHAALKAWYARPGDRLEVAIDGYIIDIVRGDLLIEVQTTDFSSLKRKLACLLPRHPVRLVYPIPQEKWLVKRHGNGQTSRRKSPQRGSIYRLFGELVSFPHLPALPNFSLEILLTQEEEIRRHEAGRRWRRGGWVTEERRLLQVVGQQRFNTPAELAALLPPNLPTPFTTADLAAALGQPRRLAQQMAYCLRELALILPAGKQGNAISYVLSDSCSGAAC